MISIRFIIKELAVASGHVFFILVLHEEHISDLNTHIHYSHTFPDSLTFSHGIYIFILSAFNIQNKIS